MTIPAAIEKAIADGLAAAIPESDLTCSEWAGKYRYISPERTARPGRWDNEVVPFLVEIMDAASDPKVRRLVFQKSSQVAGSECVNNYIGYRIHTSPTMMIYCAENEDKAKAYAQESFDTTVEVTPVLRQRISATKSSDDNNQKRKKFPGGLLTIAFASSAAQLSSRPAEVVIVDEVDACTENAEGSPVALLEARTKTFNDTKKIILVSSPRNKETSVIEPEYLESDRRQYFVPCPHCDEYQILQWANVRWQDEPLDAYYVCEVHGCVIEQQEKQEMLERGYWQASEPFRGTAGFKINELYSPFTTWGTMADAFVKAKKSPVTLKTFINTSLGETWEADGEKVDYADLSFNKEEYAAEIPDGVLLLTAAVDVQDDRLECEVVGWGLEIESWSIDYKVFYGDPGGKEIWEELRDYLTREFTNIEDEIFKIKICCIDSGGHHAQSVYKFCKANAGRRFFAIKGANVAGKPISSKPSLNNALRVKLFTVGTEAAKDMIFAQLKKQEAGPGYCHFPDTREDAYFKMLCAEKKITKFVSGRAKQFWVKVSESARNEALDLRVYNIAALHILNPDWKSYQAKRREKRAETREEVPVATEKTAAPKKSFVPRSNNFASGRSRRSGGFVGGWK